MSRHEAPLPTEAEWMTFKARLEGLRAQAFTAALDFFPDTGLVPPELVPRKTAVCFHNSHGMQSLLLAIKQHFKDGNPRDYLAFHILISSGVKYHEAPKLDLPGSFSIERFYEAVIRHPRNIYMTKRCKPAMALDGCHQ